MMQVISVENKHKDSKSKAEEDAKAAAKAAAEATAVQSGAAAPAAGAEDKKEDEDKGSSECCPQAAAALVSIAAIGCCDDLSRDMTLRMIDHILQYGNMELKRTVPLALGLLFTSKLSPFTLYFFCLKSP